MAHRIYKVEASRRIAASNVASSVPLDTSRETVVVSNETTVTVYVEFGLASNAPAFPAAGADVPGYFVLPGTVQTLRILPQGATTNLAVVLKSGTGDVYVSQGQGD